ncbi:MAG: MerR family transcriptional regulator [Deltaproteobacteria bacterium]|nr:MAG: MerR family transcriptional regulator [Deltaproteobacteria bacterium]
MSIIHQKSNYFSGDELERLEHEFADGVTAAQVVALFKQRGFRFSEASFRKYVQMGLLPTSKRVGQKGKYRGSRGLYPASVIRRINLIKRLMSQDMTLEQIRDYFLVIQDKLGSARKAMEELLDELEIKAESQSDGAERDIGNLRRQARGLLKKLEKVSSRLVVKGVQQITDWQGGAND